MNLRLDLDLYHCIAADDFFIGSVPVSCDRPSAPGAQRNLETFVKNALLTAGGNGTKRGAGVLILMPIAGTTHPDIPGPILDPFIVPALIMENAQLNYGSTGTNKTAEDILARYLQVLHQWQPGGTVDGCVVPGPHAVTELPKEFRDQGLTGYTVALGTQFRLAELTRCAGPVITLTGATATLTCATAGAAIYFTTDGSTPLSSNSLAQPYSGPITLTGSGLLRAGAQRAGLIPSRITAEDYPQ